MVLASISQHIFERKQFHYSLLTCSDSESTSEGNGIARFLTFRIFLVTLSPIAFEIGASFTLENSL